MNLKGPVPTKVNPIPLMITPDQLSELRCDNCHGIIGWAWESDLNGSYFYCEDCVENAKLDEGNDV